MEKKELRCGKWGTPMASSSYPRDTTDGAWNKKWKFKPVTYLNWQRLPVKGINSKIYNGR